MLLKAARAMEVAARDSIAETGLGLTDFMVLEVLLHKGPLPVQELGRRVLLTSGSMTAAVDRLEAEQLVERRNDAEDRRARVIHLTARGRRRIRVLFARHEAHMEAAAGGLAPTERAELLRLLRRLGKDATGLAEADRSFED